MRATLPVGDKTKLEAVRAEEARDRAAKDSFMIDGSLVMMDVEVDPTQTIV